MTNIKNIYLHSREHNCQTSIFLINSNSYTSQKSPLYKNFNLVFALTRKNESIFCKLKNNLKTMHEMCTHFQILINIITFLILQKLI